MLPVSRVLRPSGFRVAVFERVLLLFWQDPYVTKFNCPECSTTQNLCAPAHPPRRPRRVARAPRPALGALAAPPRSKATSCGVWGRR